MSYKAHCEAKVHQAWQAGRRAFHARLSVKNSRRVRKWQWARSKWQARMEDAG